MSERPLRDGVMLLLQAGRREEWTFERVLTDVEKDRPGVEGAPEIKDLLVKASAGRRLATGMLRASALGQSVDDCAEPDPPPTGTWAEAHRDAHEAMSELHRSLDEADEDRLAGDPGLQRSHPQYLWRHVTIYAVREPMLGYAEWHQRNGRVLEALSVLGRWYEAVRCAGLPTKALSDASYDLACGLARAGRLDDAMRYLPDAFTYNDRAAVPVLKAWAREDRELAPLAQRPDFRTLVGAA